MKHIRFFYLIFFFFLVVKFSIYLKRSVFVMFAIENAPNENSDQIALLRKLI